MTNEQRDELLIRLDERSGVMASDIKELKEHALPSIWRRVRRLEKLSVVASTTVTIVSGVAYYFRDVAAEWVKRKLEGGS